MATRAATRTQRQSSPAPKLKVVRRKTRKLIKRSGARRFAPTYIVAAIAVAAIVCGVLLEQVVLAQSAFRLTEINKRLATAEARQEELLAEVAELESPGRIERYARTNLGMTDPSTIEYVVADVVLGDGTKVDNVIATEDVVAPSMGSAAP